MDLRRVKLYHLTHVNNLDAIFGTGRLFCKNEMLRRNLPYTSIALEGIQETRHLFQVPAPPYGTLHDYFPFFFASKPPMLYKINHGGVTGYQDGQDPLVYLVSCVQNIDDDWMLNYVFTEGHAIMKRSHYFTNPADLDKVNWDVMKPHALWSNDDERRRQRQAEFLVHGSVPISVIAEIGVRSKEMLYRVHELVERYGLQIAITMHPQWYVRPAKAQRP